MDDALAALTERLVAFREARDWRQFHTLKDLVLSVSIEAGELLELVQWRPDGSLEAAIEGDGAFRARLADECADVLLYLLLVCERAGIDLAHAASAKIVTNEQKYPVEKSRGTAAKHDRL